MVTASSDEELFERTARGDRAALSALFARHYNRVFRFIARMTQSEAIAEEIANEVFLEIWQHADRFKGQSSAATYCLAIARNKAISQLRRRKEAPVDDSITEQLIDDEDTPDITTQKRDKANLLRDAVNALPEEFRTVIDLSYYQELSITEIADVLSVPKDTVKTRMFRARKKLATRLQSAGIDQGWP